MKEWRRREYCFLDYDEQQATQLKCIEYDSTYKFEYESIRFVSLMHKDGDETKDTWYL